MAISGLEISYDEQSVRIDTDAWGGGLLCPHCGADYLHHYGFTSYDRQEDELTTDLIDTGSVAFGEDGKIVTTFNHHDCTGRGLTIGKEISSMCPNPSARRNGIVVKFWCEMCSNVSLLCIAQHKGSSMIKWRKIYATPSKKKRKAIKPGLRFDVLKRDNYTCQTCGATTQDGATLEIDHIRPFSKGGSDEIDNLQVLCRDCNIGKGNKDQ